MLLRFFLVFCLTITTAFADEPSHKAQKWLENMSQAMKTLDYKGTVAFFKNGRLDIMKYFHIVDNGREQERLISLNSPMREVIREAGKVRCVFNKTKEVIVNHRPVSDSFIIDLPTDLTTIKHVYQLRVHDEESVAMLPTYVVSIEAKDQYRYGRKIWIDKQYFLPLKVEVYDLSGLTVEQVVFTGIDVDNKLTFADIGPQGKERHLQLTEVLSIDQASFSLNSLPLNFGVVLFTRMFGDDPRTSIEHVLLSDGFSSVSVYREAKADGMQEGLQTLGSVKSFTQVIDDFQITVLGEVPARTVKFIAQGIKLK